MIGQTISQYKILEKLGEGGMGVVYKAQDTKLDRTVALKFLPAHLNASEQDKARFVQEAKAAAAMNHPNVCSIIDIQQHDDQMFIVMEFVDGQTLRDKRGTLTFKQAIDIGIQIADGLAAAHEKGIVHRDMKPENIMVRKDGIAQIMDFGLAKLRGASSKVNRLTKEGSTVGTAGYMSPEQVMGQDVDHRSDIFSFGVVMYEMFTGQLPFRGVHETALAYEIVNVDAAPMSTLKPDIDPGLDAIVLDCLEKDPKERCQSVAEVARDLRRVKRESTRQRHSRITAARPAYTPSATMPAAAQPLEGSEPSKSSSPLPWVLTVIFLLIALGAVAFHVLALKPPEEKRVMRTQILSPLTAVYDITLGGHIAISPDGKTVVFAATDSLGINRLWVRPIRTMTALMLAGTDEARYPFWSFDSKKIGFFAKGKLRTIDAGGGPVLNICDATDGRGGAWSQNGVILFAPGPNEGLSKVAAAGGIPHQFTSFDTVRHENSHRWPMFLPDGNHFIYSTLTAAGAASDNDVIRIAALDSSMNTVLMNAMTNVCFASGQLLFIRQGTLMAQPFDAEKREFTDDAVPIAEQVIFSPNYGRAAFSASQNGMLIVQTGENQTTRTAIFDLAGNRTRVLADLGPGAPRLSPDGKRMVYHIIDPVSRNADIWINDLSQGAGTRMTFAPSVELVPAWSAHGDSIIFQSNRNGVYDLFIKSASGSGDDIPFVQSNRSKNASESSPDGKYFAYTSTGDPKTKSDLWILPLTGDRTPVPFLRTEFNEGLGSFSSDSRWIAYQSDETGNFEIYARLVNGTGGKFKISMNGGRRPFWRSDDRRIFFSSMDRRLQVAYVHASTAAVVVDSIRTVWDFESRNIFGLTVADVSQDGKQFVAIINESKLTAPPITLIVNWDEELKKR